MQVLLRNPTDESVIPFVEELCRRLPLKANKNEGVGIEVDEDEIKDFEKDGNGVSWSPQRGDQDENVPGADGKSSVLDCCCLACSALTEIIHEVSLMLRSYSR